MVKIRMPREIYEYMRRIPKKWIQPNIISGVLVGEWKRDTYHVKDIGIVGVDKWVDPETDRMFKRKINYELNKRINELRSKNPYIDVMPFVIRNDAYRPEIFLGTGDTTIEFGGKRELILGRDDEAKLTDYAMLEMYLRNGLEEIPLRSPEGRIERIETYYDPRLDAYKRYFILCLDFLKSQGMFNGDLYKQEIKVKKANFPWVRVFYNRGKRIWVRSGIQTSLVRPPQQPQEQPQEQPFIVLHDEMDKHEILATMFHELMHYFYDTGNDKFVQDKAIESLEKIIAYHGIITDPANEENFRKFGISPRLLSRRELENALEYLIDSRPLFESEEGRLVSE